jgi:hypothetical protein
MAWATAYHPEHHLIEVRYAGRTTGSDLTQATSQSIVLGYQHNTKHYLIDATDMELAASLFDLLKLPEQQYLDERLNWGSRIAIVLPRSNTSSKIDMQFYETACFNRGWQVRSFESHIEAWHWLAGSAGSIHAADSKRQLA